MENLNVVPCRLLDVPISFLSFPCSDPLPNFKSQPTWQSILTSGLTKLSAAELFHEKDRETLASNLAKEYSILHQELIDVQHDLMRMGQKCEKLLFPEEETISKANSSPRSQVEPEDTPVEERLTELDALRASLRDSKEKVRYLSQEFRETSDELRALQDDFSKQVSLNNDLEKLVASLYRRIDRLQAERVPSAADGDHIIHEKVCIF